MKKQFWNLVLIICVLGIAVTAGIFTVKKVKQIKQQQAYEELAQETGQDEEGEVSVNEAVSANEEADAEEEKTPEELLEEKYQALEAKYQIEIPRKDLDFEELQETVNEDIYAWIYVPGTEIDYPVLQHPTDDTYYLNYNLDGSKGYPGCIYTESYNQKDFSDGNTVLYGHNMKNGTMFAGLHQYEDSEFFSENPFFYIYTEEDILVYQIFRAYKYSDAHLLKSFDVETEEGMESYLEEIRSYRSLTSNANEELLEALTGADKLCTLSTCVGGDANSRYLVQGVLCNED